MPGRQDDDLAAGAVDWQCVYRAQDRQWESLSLNGQDQPDASTLHTFDPTQSVFLDLHHSWEVTKHAKKTQCIHTKLEL